MIEKGIICFFQRIMSLKIKITSKEANMGYYPTKKAGARKKTDF